MYPHTAAHSKQHRLRGKTFHFSRQSIRYLESIEPVYNCVAHTLFLLAIGILLGVWLTVMTMGMIDLMHTPGSTFIPTTASDFMLQGRNGMVPSAVDCLSFA